MALILTRSLRSLVKINTIHRQCKYVIYAMQNTIEIHFERNIFMRTYKVATYRGKKSIGESAFKLKQAIFKNCSVESLSLLQNHHLKSNKEH